MSTGKRLAKRSIIGTRVSARGKDGKYYNGYIHALKSPAASTTAKENLNISSNTLYSVRFDIVPGTKPPSPNTEFVGRDLIAPGFESIDSATFVAGQKVYLTYNGREIQAEVIHHRKQLDEVDVMIAPNGQEGTVILTKRIDDLRLSESRKSPRLADQDTDFARLADMGSDRKRSASHTIEVPQVPGSRKRRPSSNYDSERPYRNNGGTNAAVGSGAGGGNWLETARVPRGCGRVGCPTNDRGDCMDECTAALVLMSLSCSPHSPYNPLQFHNEQNYGSSGDNGVAATSPGITSGSCSNSSSASWRTATPSPVSDDGTTSTVKVWQHQPRGQPTSPYTVSASPSGSTPGSSGTWDEGIERDYADELNRPRKKTKKLSDCRTKVRRERVENRKPVTGYCFENCDRVTTPLEIKFETTPPPQLTIQRPATTPAPQRAAPAPQRATPVVRRTTPVPQRPAPAAQRQSPVAQRPVPLANNTAEDPEDLAAATFVVEKKPLVKPQENLFQCTWSSCTVVEATEADIEDHVRREHLEPQKRMELAQGIIKTIHYGEEQFYYQEVEAETMSPSPTMSHRDMARPPHEDPEYQRQLRLVAAPSAILVDSGAAVSFGNNNNINNNINNNNNNTVVKAARSASVIRKNNSKSNTIVTFGVSSPSPQPQQPAQSSAPVKQTRSKGGAAKKPTKPRKTLSGPRKGRSETKKCRKMHGMINRTTWCTQCRWKKACTRYCG